MKSFNYIGVYVWLASMVFLSGCARSGGDGTTVDLSEREIAAQVSDATDDTTPVSSDPDVLVDELQQNAVDELNALEMEDDMADLSDEELGIK